MKNQEIKAFVDENADFILLLRGDQKQLISKDEVYEKLVPLAVETNNDYYVIADPSDRYYTGILYVHNPFTWDLVRIAQRFAHILWPETQTA